MSTATATPDDGVRHYRFLCGLTLGILFLLTLSHEGPDLGRRQVQLLLSVVMLIGGGLALVSRRPMTPMLVLLPVGAVLALSRQTQGDLLDALDLALCMTTLGYVAAHYRLLALRFPPSTPRSTRAVTPAEFVGLLIQLPLFALAAQGVWYLVAGYNRVADLPPNWSRFLALTWGLALGLFTAVQVFRYWQRRQMGTTTACLMLQDVLWQETRGEQRTLNRWLAWRKRRANEG